MPGRAALGHGAGEDDAVGVEHVDQAAQDLADGVPASGLGVDGGLLACRGAAVDDGAVHGVAVLVLGVSAQLQVAVDDSRTAGDGLEVAGGTALAGHARRVRTAHVADVAGLVVGAQHDGAALHEGAADARAHGNHQAAGGVAAGAPAGLAQGVGVHVVQDARGKARGRGELGAQVGAAPAGHHVVCVGDVAGARVNDAARRDADAADVLAGKLDDAPGHLDGVGQDLLAALLGLGRNLVVELHDGLGALLEGHQSGRNLGTADVDGHYLLALCHGSSYPRRSDVSIRSGGRGAHGCLPPQRTGGRRKGRPPAGG